MTIEYLLRRHVATGDPRPLLVARRSLDAMADGGLRDQLGGGFHRYSTDARWLVPHFEQMLYDNAQLARVYVHAWALTGDARYREVATGTLDYMLRELTTDDGAFAASQDADTDGIEGLTFTWRAPEIREVLGDDAPPLRGGLRRHRRGQLGGRHDPVAGRDRRRARRALRPDRRPRSPTRLADGRGRAPRASAPSGPSRPATTRRSRPGTGWRSRPSPTRRWRSRRPIPAPRPATAPPRSGRPRRSSAGCSRPDGSLGRSWKDGRAVGQGVLEDYTHLADGLLALYEATFDERWFAIARPLMDRVLARFADPAGGFFDTADDHERLVTRPKDVQDNAVPSGNAMAARVLLRLAAWTGEGRYRDAAERAMRTVVPFVDALPDRVRPVAVGDGPRARAGRRGRDRRRARTIRRRRRSLAEVRRGFRPNQVVAVAADPAASAVPLLRGPGRARRAPDRLRLPRLRLPAAGHRRQPRCAPQLDAAATADG